MKENKKKVQWQQRIGQVAPILIGIACGLLMVLHMKEGTSAERSGYENLLALAGWLLGLYVHLIVHEAGHLVFGLRSGYRFSSFRIGSFMWLKENGKIVLKKLKIAGTGGQCLMVSPEMEDGKIPVILYNLGGCIMNVIVSAIFFAVYLLTGSDSIPSILTWTIALAGVVVALLNGIPMQTGTVNNDGYNALSLGKNKEAMYAFWLQLKVNEQLSNGIRMKDMPDEWFAIPTDEAMQNSMVAAQGVLAANRLMDQQRFEDADQFMTYLLEIESGIAGLHRNLMLCDRVYCELIRENRKEALDGMLTKEQLSFMQAMKKHPSVIRTEYAYALLAEKNEAKAESAKALFERTAKTYPYPSEVQAERELIDIASHRFQRATPSA